MSASRRLLCALGLAIAVSGAAQERPSEEELFGKPAAEKPATAPAAGAPAPVRSPEGAPLQATPAAAAGPVPPRAGDAEVLGGAGQPLPGFAAPPVPPDPLKVGGMLYLRLDTQWQQGLPPSRWPLSSPNLVDVYLDTRPNDRVRGFILGRAQVNPLVNEQAPDPTLGLRPLGNQAYLDQVWIRFDAARTVFFTAGKQQVTWGVARFWNPTDFLHFRKRDPLSVFDQRQGEWMLKLHVPWEKAGWNFYGFALFSGYEVVDQLGKIGGALRAEVVLGTLELAAEVVARAGTLPRLGVDASFGLWEIDFYGEASLGRGTADGRPQWRMLTPPDLQAQPPSTGSYQSYQPGFSPQVTVGASWSWKYSDEDALTVGAEYFYNSLGYSDPAIYPWLIFNLDYNPFYVGRSQLGIYVLAPKPGQWNNTTFILSTLGNLTDLTFVTRLDYSLQFLTYLRLEAYAAVRYGREGGAFRFSLALPPLPPYTTVPIVLPPPVADFGVALRLTL